MRDPNHVAADSAFGAGYEEGYADGYAAARKATAAAAVDRKTCVSRRSGPCLAQSLDRGTANRCRYCGRVLDA